MPGQATYTCPSTWRRRKVAVLAKGPASSPLQLLLHMFIHVGHLDLAAELQQEALRCQEARCIRNAGFSVLG